MHLSAWKEELWQKDAAERKEELFVFTWFWNRCSPCAVTQDTLGGPQAANGRSVSAPLHSWAAISAGFCWLNLDGGLGFRGFCHAVVVGKGQ